MGPLSHLNVAPHRNQSRFYGWPNVRRLPASSKKSASRYNDRFQIAGVKFHKYPRSTWINCLIPVVLMLCTSGCQESLASIILNTRNVPNEHGSMQSPLLSSLSQEGLTKIQKKIPAGDTKALLEAIELANENGSALLLQLEAGIYKLPPFSRWFDMDQRRHQDSGEISIKSDITIMGVGSGSTVITRPETKGGQSFRVAKKGKLALLNATLHDTVVNLGQLELKNVMFNGASVINKSGAYAKLTNAKIKNSNATGFVNFGKAEIRNSSIRGNKGVNLNRAGGVLTKGKLARLDIFDSFITHNVVQDECGGILAENSRLNIYRSTISHNKGGALGGGICAFGSKVAIRDSAVVANGAVEGGGIVNAKGMLSVTNVTVANNLAHKGAGLLANDSLAHSIRGYRVGRSIFRNSTITKNGYGGAHCRFCEAGGLYISTPHEAKIENTILAENHATVNAECSGELSSWGGNLLGPLSGLKNGCYISKNKNDQVANPGLGKLVDRKIAGQMYIILRSASPAIDAATQRCTRGDQLGDRRWDGDSDGVERCDVGAVEYFDQHIYLASRGVRK